MKNPTKNRYINDEESSLELKENFFSYINFRKDKQVECDAGSQGNHKTVRRRRVRVKTLSYIHINIEKNLFNYMKKILTNNQKVKKNKNLKIVIVNVATRTVVFTSDTNVKTKDKKIIILYYIL